jgi:hypothetical protein
MIMSIADTIRSNAAAIRQAASTATATQAAQPKPEAKAKQSDVTLAFLEAVKNRVPITGTISDQTNPAIKSDIVCLLNVDGVEVELFGTAKARGNQLCYLTMSTKPWVWTKPITVPEGAKKADLVALAKANGVDSKGTVTELKARLAEGVKMYRRTPVSDINPTSDLGKEMLALMLGEKGVEHNENDYPMVNVGWSKVKNGTALFFSVGNSREHGKSIGVWEQEDGSYSNATGFSASASRVKKF